MTNNKFDQLIRDKLSEVSPSAEGEAWSAFETAKSKHDNDQHASDDAFDSMVREGLKAARPGFNRDHWREMKYLLGVISERKQTILVSRIFECAVILLLVISFDKAAFLFDGNNKPYVPKPAHPASEYATAHKPNKAAGSQSLTPMASVTINTVTHNEVLASNGQQDNNVNSQAFATFVESSISVHAAKVSHIKGTTFLKPVELTKRAESQITNPDVVAITPPIMPENGTASLSQEIQGFDPLPVIVPHPESEMAIILASGDNITKQQKPRTLLSAYASGDINLINTPFDKLYSLASYNKEALNKSFGLSIARKKGNLELEAGLTYASREYQPRIVTEPYGQFQDHYFEKSLQKIKYDIASIPLQLKYHVLGRSSASIYLMAGATLNLIANASYDINEVLRSGRPDGIRILEDEARLDEKPFIKGIFNGDKLSDNYFVSVGFGVGVESKLSDHISAYIQPSYNRHILSNGIGIGPNKDKIHTSSLQIGIRAAIN